MLQSAIASASVESGDSLTRHRPPTRSSSARQAGSGQAAVRDRQLPSPAPALRGFVAGASGFSELRPLSRSYRRRRFRETRSQRRRVAPSPINSGAVQCRRSPLPRSAGFDPRACSAIVHQDIGEDWRRSAGSMLNSQWRCRQLRRSWRRQPDRGPSTPGLSGEPDSGAFMNYPP